jgi:hypothetical protein
MKRSIIAFAALGVCGLLEPSRSAAEEDNPAVGCLEQCKQVTEDCVRAAGDDPHQLQECSAQALACIEACKNG